VLEKLILSSYKVCVVGFGVKFMYIKNTLRCVMHKIVQIG
jgi:hypothetical protein